MGLFSTTGASLAILSLNGESKSPEELEVEKKEKLEISSKKASMDSVITLLLLKMEFNLDDIQKIAYSLSCSLETIENLEDFINGNFKLNMGEIIKSSNDISSESIDKLINLMNLIHDLDLKPVNLTQFL